MANTYDAIVVGGGSIGVPTALALTKRRLKTLLLERRSAVGQGENKAAIGGVRATHSDPAKILLCMRTLDTVSTWKETYGDNIGWKTGGYAFPAYSEQVENTLRDLLPNQRQYGLVNDYIDKKQMIELVPGINEENLRGGTYSPNDGQVSSLMLPPVLMRHAMKNGADIHVNERVTGYVTTNNAISGVVTDKGQYSAPIVVIASGSDASEHGKMLNINIPVTPDSHEAGITAPVEHFLGPLVVDLRPGPEGKTVNFYFGQNHEGQIIFCYSPKELFTGTNHESLSEFLPIVASRMISLVPRFKHLLVRRVWRGCYPMTPDGVPIISNVENISGLTLAVGMCGQGFMLGIGVGEEAASLAVDHKYKLPREASDTLRFERNYFAGKKEALK